MASLTGGTTNNCATPISGGVSAFYITDAANVAAYVLNLANEVTGVTMALATVFYKFEAGQDTKGFTEEVTNENCSFQATQQALLTLRGRSQAYRNTIMELGNSCCGLAVIHIENTGLQWIWGVDEDERVFLFTNSGSTGLAKSDPNQEAVVLQATATKKARVFTGVIPV